jgi:hypothetical protein
METLQSIEKEWLAVKSEYQDLINCRAALLDDENFSELTHQNGWMTKYFPEEKRLFKKSEELRKKLVRLDPKNFHCGWINMVKNNKKTVHRISMQGDHGFVTCMECHRLFDPVQFERKRTKLTKVRLSNEAFKNCNCHKAIKSCGIIKKRFTEEDFQ